MSPAPTEVFHPLDPATADELARGVALIRATYGADVKLHFKAGGLEEPPKKQLIKYLQAERAGLPVPALPRCMAFMYYIKYTPRLFEAIVDITNSTITHHKELGREFYAPVDRLEMNEAAQVALADAGVKAEIERLQLGDTAVVLDPWDYGRDDPEEQRRLAQVFFYKRNPKNNSPDSNHYAFPLDFMCVVDLVKMEIVSVSHLALGAGIRTGQNYGPQKITAPLEPEYDHALQSFPPRTTLKPLQIVQPEGTSYKVTGNLVEWEKWRFRVGFNWREGMVLHDLTFDGRETFHRISLAEMFVPYGDPRDPLHRKGAFDLGNVGAGITANDLSLGCDCLGVIKYFSGAVVNSLGDPVAKNNAICMHEIDDGIQWKHTNHRTGKASIVRRRQLVLQTILTVANYEYILMFYLDQAGEIIYETRATGILSTTPIDPENTEKVPFATRVGEGVLAPYHQHIFNLRIDPAIDGHQNSVVVSDSVSMPWSKDLNPHGTGYQSVERTVKVSGTENTDPYAARTFKIVNPNKINPVSLSPVGYKLMPYPSQNLLALPDSWHARRADFAHAPIWITKYQDRELFPAGDYTNQSSGGAHGIKTWVDRKDNVENEDIVLWHTYTFTHNPRPEDFPIMPAEMVRIHLKPTSFFNYNPTMDIPASKQDFNQSKAYDETLKMGADSAEDSGKATNGHTNGNGVANGNGCCKN
ncbi:hypothetical protein JCM10207_005800 [Rhodosporidiobolus poonsookiae]